MSRTRTPTFYLKCITRQESISEGDNRNSLAPWEPWFSILFFVWNARGSTRNLKYTLTPLLFGSFKLAERVSKAELVCITLFADRVWIHHTHLILLYLDVKEGKEVRFKAKKVLVFAHEIVTALTAYCPELAFQMWLQCVSVADRWDATETNPSEHVLPNLYIFDQLPDRCNYPVIAYEFMTQAFVVYEEELASDSKEQRSSLLVQDTIFC